MGTSRPTAVSGGANPFDRVLLAVLNRASRSRDYLEAYEALESFRRYYARSAARVRSTSRLSGCCEPRRLKTLAAR
jgi:hypothetical protein